MVIIIIRKDSIEVSGHAKDAVVCHGVSAIVQMVANYAEEKKWGKVHAGEGYLKIYDIGEEYRDKSIFPAMSMALKDMMENYPGNIEIQYSE